MTDRPGHDRRYALDCTKLWRSAGRPATTFASALADDGATGIATTTRGGGRSSPASSAPTTTGSTARDETDGCPRDVPVWPPPCWRCWLVPVLALAVPSVREPRPKPDDLPAMPILRAAGGAGARRPARARRRDPSVLRPPGRAAVRHRDRVRPARVRGDGQLRGARRLADRGPRARRAERVRPPGGPRSRHRPGGRASQGRRAVGGRHAGSLGRHRGRRDHRHRRARRGRRPRARDQHAAGRAPLLRLLGVHAGPRAGARRPPSRPGGQRRRRRARAA